MTRREGPSRLRIVAAFLGAGPVVGAAVAALALRFTDLGQAGPDPTMPHGPPHAWFRLATLPVALWAAGMLVGGLPALVTTAFAWETWRPMRRRGVYVLSCAAVGFGTMAAIAAFFLTISDRDETLWSVLPQAVAGGAAVGVAGACAGAVAALLTLPPRIVDGAGKSGGTADHPTQREP